MVICYKKVIDENNFNFEVTQSKGKRNENVAMLLKLRWRKITFQAKKK